MMIRNTVVFLALQSVAACAASPQNHYYELMPAPHAETTLDKGSAAQPKLSLILPAYLDRPQIVIISEDGQTDINEFDRWAEPLDGMVRRVLQQDMAAASARTTASTSIDLTIDTFIFGDGQVTLKAHWTKTPQNQQAGTHHASPRALAVTVPATGISAAVAAMSDLLAQLAQAMAAGPR
jgi:uncharacterized lipoprotein YmbA